MNKDEKRGTCECKQCNPCLLNVLAAQDYHKCAADEINAILAESDVLTDVERKLLRSIRTYVGLAHNALNHVFDGQGRGDLKEAHPMKIRGENDWGGKPNKIREAARGAK